MKKSGSIAVSTERAKELKAYAKFLNDSEVSYVVDQAWAYLFSRDRAYQSYVKALPPPPPLWRRPSKLRADGGRPTIRPARLLRDLPLLPTDE